MSVPENERGEGLSRRRFLARAGLAAAAAACAPGCAARGEGNAARQPDAASSADAPKVTKAEFGRMPDGTAIDLYTLSAGGLEARVMTYGATLTQVLAPDKAGRAAVVTLYLDTLADYLAGHPLFGSTVGRFANRIAGAKFVIDGAEHKLTANAGQHHIHGGVAEGFQKAVWRAEIVPEPGTAAVRMTHTSPDGAAGYPGTLRATVLFKVTPDRRLTLDYTAQTDKPTHVNLTNHAYWNLAGAGSGDVLGHVLSLRASRVLAADESRMPTGEILSVRGTPLDFTSPHTIGERVRQTQGENYDDCYVLDKPPGERLALAAIVTEPASDRVMTVHTTQPGVQLYTARHLTDRLRAGGRPYGPYHGLCLETQHFPNAPNHPEWPTTLLRPGETLHETTVHAFSTT